MKKPEEDLKEAMRKAHIPLDEFSSSPRKIGMKSVTLNDKDHVEYYQKHVKKFDKQLKAKLSKLKKEILEIERTGERNSRFDVILEHPQGEQKDLVERHKKLSKKYTTLYCRNYELKIKKQWEQIKTLPELKPDQKYYVVFVREGDWADHISYKKYKEDAVKELEINEIFYKTMRKDLKGKVEIIPAKNIEDVRNQLHSRGRENYLITGDTYKNKGKIRNIARVKFDYELKGYRGEFSPKELEELRKLTGIEIEKIQPTTKEDIEASKTAKAHSKAKKYVRHERVKGSIWQNDNPFTEEQNALEDSLTWIFRRGDDSKDRLNRDFQDYVKNKEDSIKRKLRLKNIEDAPEDVLDAIDRYRKEVYNKILANLRGKQVAPSMAITGSSNYKGNFDKRESIERNAYEKYKKVDKAVDRVVGQYVNLKKTKTAEERRQEYREKITPKLIEAKAKGKKAFSYLDDRWYDIIRVNKKSITVHSDFMGDFTIDKHFIKSIEK